MQIRGLGRQVGGLAWRWQEVGTGGSRRVGLGCVVVVTRWKCFPSRTHIDKALAHVCLLLKTVV